MDGPPLSRPLSQLPLLLEVVVFVTVAVALAKAVELEILLAMK